MDPRHRSLEILFAVPEIFITKAAVTDSDFWGESGMKMRRLPLAGIAALCALGAPAAAQQLDSAAPSKAGTGLAAAGNSVDPATVPMPNLSFTPDAEIERNYFKYFFFQRTETDFDTAYADLQECDGYARGLAYRAGGGPSYIPTPASLAGALGGAVGGLIGSALSDAIYGSAERRRLRRVNLRTCMGYKGYQAFGLPRNLWREFNFDEGNRAMPDDERQRYLRIQARVASGPRPQMGEMPQ